MISNDYYSIVPENYTEDYVRSKIPHDLIFNSLKLNENKRQKFVTLTIVDNNLDIDKLNHVTGLEFSIKRKSFELYIIHTPCGDDVDINVTLQNLFTKICANSNSELYRLYKPDINRNYIFASVNEACYNDLLSLKSCEFNRISLTFYPSKRQKLKTPPSTPGSPYARTPCMSVASSHMECLEPNTKRIYTVDVVNKIASTLKAEDTQIKQNV
jgi:hypothetical protein